MFQGCFYMEKKKTNTSQQIIDYFNLFLIALHSLTCFQEYFDYIQLQENQNEGCFNNKLLRVIIYRYTCRDN